MNKKWRKDQILKAQLPILKSLGSVLERAYPKPGFIINALNENEEYLTTEIWKMIDSLIVLKEPSKFEALDDKDYILIADDDEPPINFKVSKVEAVPLIEGDEKISGYDIFQMAKNISGFGRHHGQYILDHWYDLPKEFWDIIEKVNGCAHFILPGTLWIRKSDSRCFIEGILGGRSLTPSYARSMDAEYDKTCYVLRIKK